MTQEDKYLQWMEEFFCEEDGETCKEHVIEASNNGEYYSTPKYLVRPSGYQFVDENGNVINAWKVVLEKKKEYPKTYEECCKVLGLSEFEYNHTGTKVWYRHRLMATLDKLMLCRDAYWKIAGEEMGLGKPWEPDRDTKCYVISRGSAYGWGRFHILEFPTPEMRDAFFENFKEEIEICKELL